MPQEEFEKFLLKGAKEGNRLALDLMDRFPKPISNREVAEYISILLSTVIIRTFPPHIEKAVEVYYDILDSIERCLLETHRMSRLSPKEQKDLLAKRERMRKDRKTMMVFLEGRRKRS